MGQKEFEMEYRKLFAEQDDLLNSMKSGIRECSRVENVMKNMDTILDDLDNEFYAKTKLGPSEEKMLFLAIGLQLARQYLVTYFPKRIDDQQSAKNNPFHHDEHSNRKHRYYEPSLEEIITNPVPFDAIDGSGGVLKGGGIFGHRGITLGHDPILGLIFGTANIATATLTTTKFDSYHIISGNRDMFGNRASTELVMRYTCKKMFYEGYEGKAKIVAALVKEIIHLQTDINTKRSLPIPILTTVNPGLACKLAQRGLDMLNLTTIGKQITLSIMIDNIISMLRTISFYYGENDQSEGNWEIYEVKTRKILSYSHIVSSSTNLAVVLGTKNSKLLDIGGIGVTIYNLINSKKFIRQVKRDFINGKYEEIIMGEY